MEPLHTIGHSNHEIGAFLGLLNAHAITLVCDVRSSPYSRYNPQFNRETLMNALEAAGIGYEFMGGELGPRRDDADFMVEGRMDYRLIARSFPFQQGIERLFMLIERERIALMCAEKDPIQCHRTILIARNLRNDIPSIRHIIEDGGIEDHRDTEKRLLRESGTDPDQLDMFADRDDLIEKAYDRQARRIAHTVKEGGDHG